MLNLWAEGETPGNKGEVIMVVYADSKAYIAAETQQLKRAIRALRRRMRRQGRRHVDLDAATDEFFANYFQEFAVAFRRTHRVRGL